MLRAAPAPATPGMEATVTTTLPRGGPGAQRGEDTRGCPNENPGLLTAYSV